MKELDLINRFSGMDINQTRDYVKVGNKTYTKRVMERHSHWMKDFPPSNDPVPMNPNPDSQHKLENEDNMSTTAEDIQQLEREFQFKYRSATGELIFAMVTSRPDISFPCVKLCQYNSKPGRVHFEAVRDLMLFWRDTADEGIYFWRQSPNLSLPQGTMPKLHAETYARTQFEEQTNPFKVFGLTDSDWASDTEHRKSVSGIGMIYAGAVIVFKTSFQKAIANSSTEAEFFALSEGSRLMLYIRSILEEIGMEQEFASPIYEDNQGCLLMVNSGKPTKRARHIDIKQFSILDWVETDLLHIKRVSTHDNSVDALTKALGKNLYHRHNEVLMGKIPPSYAKHTIMAPHPKKGKCLGHQILNT